MDSFIGGHIELIDGETCLIFSDRAVRELNIAEGDDLYIIEKDSKVYFELPKMKKTQD
tara:strand:- start:14644 stop:14817 length:174 start_codon:yes stop_codon:yes gene_type:complete